jgi:hypothetical protein
MRVLLGAMPMHTSWSAAMIPAKADLDELADAYDAAKTNVSILGGQLTASTDTVLALTDELAAAEGQIADLQAQAVTAQQVAADDAALIASLKARLPYRLGSSRIDDAEAQLGTHLTFSREYLSWGDPVRLKTSNHIPVLSITMEGMAWSAVASGAQDATIIRHATAVKAMPCIVYLSLQHEPENKGLPSADYVAAWRHYITVFRAQNVSNVRWTLILMANSFGRNAVAADFYPGDDMIDVVGVDGYNWLGTGASGNADRSFSSIFAGWRTFCQAHNKPGMITEFAAAQANPNRAAWIADATRVLAAWPDVIAACWWNSGTQFTITSDMIPALQALR